jgi:hypothetical protein
VPGPHCLCALTEPEHSTRLPVTEYPLDRILIYFEVESTAQRTFIELPVEFKVRIPSGVTWCRPPSIIATALGGSPTIRTTEISPTLGMFTTLSFEFSI